MSRPRPIPIAILVALLVLAGLATVAAAQTRAMREQVYERLSRAQEATEAGDFAEAYDQLARLEKMKDLQPNEKAQLYTAYGYAYFSQERYDEAAAAYEQVLAQENLSEVMRTSTLYTLGQLHFHLEHYDLALQRLEEWLAMVENPGPEPFVLMGQALYQLGRLDEAAGPVRRAIAEAEERGQPPKENWYALLRVIYFESGDQERLLDVLKTLVARFPRKEYWIHLASAYGEAGDARRQLATYELAHAQGFLTSGAEIVQLSQLLLQAEVPYRAATLLQDGLDRGTVEATAEHWRLLAQAWNLAQEHDRAIVALGKAAELSDDGELDARIAQSYANLGQWEQAAAAAATALAKGVDDPQDMQMMRGMAFFELGRFGEAKTAFTAAMRSASSRESASRWLAYVEREEQRLQELGIGQ